MTFTVNTTICSGCSSTVASRPSPTTCSWVTTSTEANSHSRPSVCFSPTRSNSPRTSSYCVAITSAPRSTASTASTTNANVDTTSNYGRRSPIASTVCPSLPSSTRRSSAATVASRPTYSQWNRSDVSCDQPMCPTKAYSAICSGPTRTRTSLAGARTIEACRSRSASKWWPSFFTNTTST